MPDIKYKRYIITSECPLYWIAIPDFFLVLIIPLLILFMYLIHMAIERVDSAIAFFTLIAKGATIVCMNLLLVAFDISFT